MNLLCCIYSAHYAALKLKCRQALINAKEFKRCKLNCKSSGLGSNFLSLKFLHKNSHNFAKYIISSRFPIKPGRARAASQFCIHSQQLPASPRKTFGRNGKRKISFNQKMYKIQPNSSVRKCTFCMRSCFHSAHEDSQLVTSDRSEALRNAPPIRGVRAPGGVLSLRIFRRGGQQRFGPQKLQRSCRKILQKFRCGYIVEIVECRSRSRRWVGCYLDAVCKLPTGQGTSSSAFIFCCSKVWTGKTVRQNRVWASQEGQGFVSFIIDFLERSLNEMKKFI